jgi:hypothetical protein
MRAAGDSLGRVSCAPYPEVSPQRNRLVDKRSVVLNLRKSSNLALFLRTKNSFK